MHKVRLEPAIQRVWHQPTPRGEDKRQALPLRRDQTETIPLCIAATRAQPGLFFPTTCRQSPSSTLTFQTIVLFTMTRLELNRPGASWFQRILTLLPINPRLQPGLIDGKIDNSRLAEQFPEGFNHSWERKKNDFIHRFWLPLASVSIEVDPTSIWSKNEHIGPGNLSSWRHARLNYEIRSRAGVRTEIQDLRVAVVIGDRSQSITIREQRERPRSAGTHYIYVRAPGRQALNRVSGSSYQWRAGSGIAGGTNSAGCGAGAGACFFPPVKRSTR
jgi:hypothetical protein